MIARMVRACCFGFFVVLVLGTFLITGCQSDSGSRRDSDAGGGGSCCGH